MTPVVAQSTAPGARRVLLLLAAIVLGLAACTSGAEPANSERPNGASSLGPTAGDNMDSAGSESGAPVADVTIAQLEQSLAAYVDCARPQLSGFVRVNFDRFLAINRRVGLEDGRDDEATQNRIDNACLEESQLLPRADAYQASYTLERDQVAAMTDEVIDCLDLQANPFARELEQRSPEDADSLISAVSDIPYPNDATTGRQLTECVDTALYGEKTEF